MPPAVLVVVLGEYLGELLQSLLGVLVFRIEYEIVVLGQQGDEALLGVLQRPGQLIEKVEYLLVVESVPGHTVDGIQYRVEIDTALLHLFDYQLANKFAVVQLVQAGDVQHAEVDFRLVNFRRSRLEVRHRFGHGVGRVPDLHGLAARQLPGGC